jgi:hypothetical protein
VQAALDEAGVVLIEWIGVPPELLTGGQVRSTVSDELLAFAEAVTEESGLIGIAGL